MRIDGLLPRAGGLLLWLAAAGLGGPALAADGPGPRGPVGPKGRVGPPGSKVVPAASAAAVAPSAAATRPPQGNRIEASGNQATGIGCSAGGASVNSVDVRGARLQGRTVIVQGRNTHDVDTRDCPPPTAAPAAGTAPAQVNSIHIR